MGQRQHSNRKVSTPDLGLVVVAGNFPSAIAQDGSFDLAIRDSDGYIAVPEGLAPNDAYGSGFRGIMRTGAGSYDIVLDRVYPELVAASGSVHTTSDGDKLLGVQFTFPLMETLDPSTGEDVSMVKLRLVNDVGAKADAAYNDRISFVLYLRNTSV